MLRKTRGPEGRDRRRADAAGTGCASIAAREGSPAAKAGLRTGDFIRAIDDKPTREMSAWTGARLLRGAPGSKVKLTMIRGNAAEPHVVELVREADTAPEVTGRIVKPGVGLLRIAVVHRSHGRRRQAGGCHARRRTARRTC